VSLAVYRIRSIPQGSPSYSGCYPAVPVLVGRRPRKARSPSTTIQSRLPLHGGIPQLTPYICFGVTSPTMNGFSQTFRPREVRGCPSSNGSSESTTPTQCRPTPVVEDRVYVAEGSGDPEPTAILDAEWSFGVPLRQTRGRPDPRLVGYCSWPSCTKSPAPPVAVAKWRDRRLGGASSTNPRA
jgi:hypothetical protein